MTRRKLKDAIAAPVPAQTVGETDYFLDPKVETFETGCTGLNLALGGGWPVRRMFNVVGDKSTGKTLLMIEACAGFLKKYPHGDIIYCEVEAAFDKEYAGELGMPLDRVRFIADEIVVCKKGAKKAKKDAESEDPKKKRSLKTWRIPQNEFDPDKHDEVSDGIYTVEQLEMALLEVLESAKVPTLFIIDSYDALSDDAEMSRAADDHATYAMQKAKHGSAMFRKLNQRLAKSNVTFGIVSQVRANIGVTFGRATKRSGGMAMDFYATHVIYLQKLKNLVKTRGGIKRVHGISVLLKVDKNKIGVPHREIKFPILFGYGVEDVVSCTNWLVEHEKWSKVFDSKKDAASLINNLDKLSDAKYAEWQEDLADALTEAWREVEATFLPKRRKYARTDQ